MMATPARATMFAGMERVWAMASSVQRLISVTSLEPAIQNRAPVTTHPNQMAQAAMPIAMHAPPAIIVRMARAWLDHL
jgi:hypothetical protein